MLRDTAASVVIVAFFSLPTASAAESPLEALRKSVAEAYAKVDSLSISCFVVERCVSEDRVSAMSSAEFRYSRATKQLAVGSEGIPYLLVNGDRLKLHAFGDLIDMNYLDVDQGRPVTWNDVDAARKKVESKCTLGQPTVARFVGFALPFLEGGMDRLFSKATTLLDEKDATFLVQAGHPDNRVFIGEQEPRKLDPARNPICIRTTSDVGTWEYAFDRNTHLMTAARGIVDSEMVTGFPGPKYEIVMIKTVSFNGEPSVEPSEVQFERPQGSRLVRAADLHAAYIAELKKSDFAWKEVERLGESNLKSLIEKKTELNQEISALRSDRAKNKALIVKKEAESEEINAGIDGSTKTLARLRAVVAEIESGSTQEPPKNPTFQPQAPSQTMSTPAARSPRRITCRRSRFLRRNR